MARIGGSTIVVFALQASVVAAQMPTYGDGHAGDLVVDDTRTINDSAPLSAPVAAGSRSVQVATSTPFFAGDAVLLIQLQWLGAASRDDVGAYEVHRLSRVEEGVLTLEEDTGRAFPAGAALAVTLPEYSSVVIQPDAGLVAPRWNGAAGGVLAFLVRGALRNNGRLDATGAGLRGGVGVDAVDERGGCMALDEPPPGGSQRGEGHQVGRYAPNITGRGANDSGGGGAMCPFSGAGGGAHLGNGGVGGLARDATTVGGQGGLAHAGLAPVMGGGGGAANGLGADARSGGAGGGIIFIRALTFEGFGRVEANGQPGGSAVTRVGAGSGGGAGGTVWLDVDGDVLCVAEARGGAGGSTSATGPGGGGGGGFVHVRAAKVVACPASVTAGAPGLASGASYGAGPLLPADPPHAGLVDVVQGEPGTPTMATAPAAYRLSATGCGCASAGPPLLAWLAAGAMRRRRR